MLKTTNYQTFQDHKEEHVSWQTFFTVVGGANEARCPIVEGLKGIGQTEVTSPEESDYLLVFCPVVSRVGTDIAEALDNIPRGKPAILVVMHHTFNPYHVVAESRSQVSNSEVHLTVDCLFYEGRLLDCKRNDAMWGEFWKFFEVTVTQRIGWQIKKCLRSPWTWCAVGIIVLAAAGISSFLIEWKRHSVKP